MDAYEAMMDTLEGFDYRIHRKGEKGFEDLKDEDLMIEVINKEGDDDLTIEFSEGEYSLFFGGDHDHFDPAYDDEIYWFIDLLDDILHNNRCAALLYYNTDDFPRLLATSFCKAKDAEQPVEKLFSYVMELQDYKAKLENNGGKMIFRFWDPSLNKEELIEKKGKTALA
ncbi:MAG: hypothetical protein IJI46_08385 [Erysipelotrichaceae bacterium]|nr:hypothetical protein [Erysipelotrichaceae bacterium]